MKQPFPKTWWVKEGEFLAGCFPGTPEPDGPLERLSSLVAVGIRTFISLQEENERNTGTGAPFPHYEGILRMVERQAGTPLVFHRFPVRDCTAPSPDVTTKVLDAIDDSLADGRPVYVHCWGGHGRTGAIVGCWLVRHGTSGADALTTVKRLRAQFPELAREPAPQVEAQRELVCKWASLDPNTEGGTGLTHEGSPVGPEVGAFLKKSGLTPVVKRDPRSFKFRIGERFKAPSDGGTRVIRGYCLGHNQVPLYVVGRPTGRLTTKTAEKAHLQYVPADQEPGGSSGDLARAARVTVGSIKNHKPLKGDSPLLIGVEPLSLHDRYLGALFGLAVGDAVGTTLEFKPPGSFSPISDMVGGGPFGLKVGQWTDDTSMALCLAESLVHTCVNDAADQMRRYVAWWQKGHLGSTGSCFDIGNATRAALSRFVQTGDAMAGSTDPHTAGNGSLMRLAPIPLAYRVNADSAIAAASESSRTTHAAVEAVDACRFMTVLMIRALQSASKEDLLGEELWRQSLHYPTDALAPKVLTVAKGSYKTKEPPAIRGTGYVVDCLEAALWAFHKYDNYQQAVLAAANLGDDADTTAAVCGQLAGAFYGLTGIPAHWVQQVAMRDTIAELARGLLTLSKFLGELGI